MTAWGNQTSWENSFLAKAPKLPENGKDSSLWFSWCMNGQGWGTGIGSTWTESAWHSGEGWQILLLLCPWNSLLPPKQERLNPVSVLAHLMLKDQGKLDCEPQGIFPLRSWYSWFDRIYNEIKKHDICFLNEFIPPHQNNIQLLWLEKLMTSRCMWCSLFIKETILGANMDA